MNVVLQKPWTAERFLAWAETQDERYEFDGIRPVAMTGGNARHDTVTGNLNLAIHSRLRGKPCSTHGPNLGVETTHGAIRYPDALITCTKFRDTAKLAPDPVGCGRTAKRVDRLRRGKAAVRAVALDCFVAALRAITARFNGWRSRAARA